MTSLPHRTAIPRGLLLGIVASLSGAPAALALQSPYAADDPLSLHGTLGANQAYGSAVALDTIYTYDSADPDALAMSTLAVGAPGAAAQSPELVYVYTRDWANGSWTQQQVLTLGPAGRSFGAAVDLDANTLVVGSPGFTSGAGASAGAVSIYTRSGGTWTQQAELTSPGAVAFEFFGSAVALDGDTLVVGAPAIAPALPTAYVFTRTGLVWSYTGNSVSGAAGSAFGAAVATSQGRMLVGAPAVDQATAYDITVAPPTLETSLHLNTGTGQSLAGSGFGSSVAFDLRIAVVGAPAGLTTGGVAAGNAHVWVRIQTGGPAWFPLGSPESSSPAAGDNFGSSVDVDAAYASTAVNPPLGGAYVLAAGVPGDDVQGSGNGSVRIFTVNVGGGVWTEDVVLTSATASPSNGAYGSAVAVHNGAVCGGAPLDATQGSNAGAVTLYTGTPSQTRFCTGSVNTQGCIPLIQYGGGIPSLTLATPFVVSATRVVANKPGLLLYGYRSNGEIPFAGGGLCATPVLRDALGFSSGDPTDCSDASNVISYDLNLQLNASPTFEAGESLVVQWWMRDTGAPNGSDAVISDALEFTLQP